MKDFSRTFLRMLPVMIIVFAFFVVIVMIIVPQDIPIISAEAQIPEELNHNINYFKDNIKNFFCNTLFAVDNIITKENTISTAINLVYDDGSSKIKGTITKIDSLMGINYTMKSFNSSTEDKIDIDEDEFISLFIEKNYKEVISKYEKDKETNFNPNIRYIIAFSLFKEDKYNEAIKILDSIKEEDVIFYDYVMFYKASSYYYIKDYKKAGELFSHIRNKYPNFLLINKVVNFEAESYYKDGINIKLFSEFEKGEMKEQQNIIILLCKAYYENKNYDKALEYAFNIIESKNYNNTKEIFPIVTEIYKNKEKIGSIEKLRISKGYFTLYDYHKAAELLSKLDSFDDKELEYERLNYLAGVYWRLKKYNDAISLYQKIMNTYDNYRKEKAIYNIAQVLIDYGNIEESVQELNLLIENKKHSFRKDSLLLLVSLSSKSKDYPAMFEYMKLLAKDYNTIYDCWNYILNLINESQFGILIKELPNYIKYVGNNHYLSKLYFWLGCSYEVLEEWDNAYKSFQKVITYYNNHYYTYRAFTHIKDIYKAYIEKKLTLEKPKNPSDIEKEIETQYKEFFSKSAIKEKLNRQISPDKVSLETILNEQSKKALSLIGIGDFINGFAEWDSFYKSFGDKGKYSLYLIQLFQNSSIYHKAIGYAETIVNNINEGIGKNYIPVELLKNLYPTNYSEYVEPITREFNVNSKLVYSIIREESRFYHLAVSWAGAEGLMQLMPSTGKWLADKLKRTSYRPFNPYENIYLGAKFFSDLLKQFETPLAIGAYNAGGGRMGKYVKSFYKDYNIINIEHFVENIPIEETRNYIIKVIGSYSMYEKIY